MTDRLPHTLRSDALNNRESILDAARALFSADGLTVPMREVARRAGVGPATLYRHFPTKHMLVAEAFTDQHKLRSHHAAHREVMPPVEHRSHKGMNNRAENSHQPTRQREQAMKGFRSTGGAQRFLSAFSGISPHFRPCRHLTTASGHRAEMTVRFAIRKQVTGAANLPTTA
ncbi:TetR family transcriptional regulator [Streptomyces beigongshangae]|uniref:TetR family transcriptional regulator n=1 Tax=Streptomyces beigongshangae TaxID=2841597 RepID=UPI0027E184F8|nr:TetR family transcriptional regulator [Streptomyces sp. REN17]